MSPTRSTRRALTLIEVMISTVILTVIVLAVGSLVQTSGQTSSLVYEQSRVQLEAQRIMRTVRDQLRMTGVNGTGNLTFAAGGTFPIQWTFRYRRLLSTQLWNGGFDPNDPYGATMIPWEANESALKFELTEGASLDGIDNDGDFLTDEGRIALYSIDGSGTETLTAVLGQGITAAAVDTTQLGPADPAVRPRVGLTITVERVLQAAVRGQADVNALTAGTGPRVRYTAQTWIALPN